MREALMQNLRGQSSGTAVWTADLSYWIAGRQADGTAKPSWATELGQLELCRELGTMPYYWYGKFWAGQPVYPNDIAITSHADGGDSRTTWRTPVGHISLDSRYCADSVSTAIVRYPVNTAEDLKVLLYLLEHRRLEPSNLADYHERMTLWAGYDGLPCLALPRSPLAALLVEWAGVENTVFLLADEPDLCARAMELMEEQESSILDALGELAPPLIHFADNLSANTVAGLFDRYMAGVYRRRVQRLHQAGVRCAVHLDGTIRGLLGPLVATGIDAVEALTPLPCGDVPLEDMRTLAGHDRVVLWGGVPGAMFAPPYTWKDMKVQVERLLASWGGTPFVVGVADQIPPDGDITFCNKIADLVRHY
jgi:hypothetical protein